MSERQLRFPLREANPMFPYSINQAVRLGLGYPQGPLDLGDFVGPQRILAILEAMHTFYGDPRYRPSPWLKRRALLEISLNTLEW